MSGTVKSPGCIRAFTMMELMVSIAILVLIILGVNLTFHGASQSVGLSQATMEMMANVRAIQQQIEADVAGMDKSCFLVIRSRKENTVDPFPRRFDQISFISVRGYPNRNGSNNSGSYFSENTVANAAHVWWGQLALEKYNPVPNTYPYPSYLNADQRTKVALNQDPSGAMIPNTQDDENAFVLGTHKTLLLPGPLLGTGAQRFVNVSGSTGGITAYAGINYRTPSVQTSGELVTADITSSRFGAAAISPGQIAQQIANDRLHGTLGNAPEPLFEAYNFCYRFKSLASVYEAEPGISPSPYANAYFRMTPFAMQGVSSFQVEWTDGSTETNSNTPSYGELRWYGPHPNTLPQGWTGPVPFGPKNLNAYNNPSSAFQIEHAFSPPDPNTKDDYIAIFSIDTPRSAWPKALRFTYHVVDPQNRLKGGRDFTQVVKLPD